ncbi:bifunctional DNA primase/polymerase [Mycobacteroides abscessus subsp. abscessus]|uniref:bifunctional DNA primase/polymerase n=1 Tax=Mycobacteroides abscessus TaxID=36809 RepID=UPI0039F14A06
MTVPHSTDTATRAPLTFESFLAERPQLELSGPVPGGCSCPAYRIGDKPIFTRHQPGCSSTGSDHEVYTYWHSEPNGQRLMRSTTLEALAAWIPVPPAPPAADPAAATAAIDRMLQLEFHLVRLHPGTKHPIGNAWNDPVRNPALTRDQALAHVAAGGGLGVLLGPSRLIVVDAENVAAVQALAAAGLRPVLLTAKGRCPVTCDPRADKRGGGHIWLRVPEGVDPAAIANAAQRRVGADGLVDILIAPGSMAVVPPTALVEAGGWGYAPDPTHPVWSDAEPDTAPMWLFDATVPCPSAELENLHGCLAPTRTAREQLELNARSIELTDEIDSIEWDEWLGGDERLTETGEVDSCGCSIWHWAGASTEKSLTLHDGCAQGAGAHIWSATMRATLDLAEHVSRLDLACALRGESRREVAASVGIELGGEHPELGSVTPEDLEADAAALEAAAATGTTTVTRPGPGGTVIPVEVGADGLLQRAGARRAAAGVMRVAPVVVNAPVSLLNLTEASEEDEIVSSNVVQLRALPGGGDTEDDADDSERDEDMVLTTFNGTAPTPGQVMQYPMPEIPSHVPPVAGAVTTWRAVLPPVANARTHDWVCHEWIFSATPGLSHVAAAADARGVARWGLLGALLPRVAAAIPPAVRLNPPASNIEVTDGDDAADDASGTSLNVYSVLVSGPSLGKTNTMTEASVLIPNGVAGVRTLPPGTGEGFLKEFPAPHAETDDEAGAVPPIGSAGESGDSILLESDEIDVFAGEMMRQGSKTTGWYRSMWMGGEIGNTVSDKDRRSFIAAHSYRFGILLGAQPDAVVSMFSETSKGTPQRFLWLPAQQQAVARGSYPRRLQTAVPQWFDADGWAPPAGVQRPPVWVKAPAAAAAQLKRDRWRAAAGDPTAASREADLADSIAKRHAVLHLLKLSTLLAALDGLTQPQDAHWFVAEAIMAVRREVISRLVQETNRAKAEGKRLEGEFQGIARHAADAAREAERDRHVSRCAAGIMKALVEDAEKGRGPRTHAAAIRALSGKKGATGQSDRTLYGRAALGAVLAAEGVINTGTHVRFAASAA